MVEIFFNKKKEINEKRFEIYLVMSILTLKNILSIVICILFASLFFFLVYQPHETILNSILVLKDSISSTETKLENKIELLNLYSYLEQKYIISSFSLFFALIFFLIGINIFFNTGKDFLKKENIFAGVISILSAFFY